MTKKEQLAYIRANIEDFLKNEDFTRNVLPQTYYKKMIEMLDGDKTIKKYEDMTKKELIAVIAAKNDTIARINGEMYCLKKWYRDYRHKKQVLYAKIQAEREAKNDKQ